MTNRPLGRVGAGYTVTPNCPSWAQLVEWLEGGPVEGCAPIIDWHVPECDHCRERLEFVDELKRLLSWRPVQAHGALEERHPPTPERP